MFEIKTSYKKFLNSVIITLLAVIACLITINIFNNYPPENGKILKNGNLIGGDFIAFYIGGKLFNEHPDKVYDLYFQREFRENYLEEAKEGLNGELPFVYPPLVAAYASQFAKLDLETAFYLWTIVGLILSLVTLLLLVKSITSFKAKYLPLTLLAIFGYLPFYLNTFMGGQMSWVGVSIFSLMVILLSKEKNFLAGLILSLGYYKPPLFVIAALYLAIRKGKNFVLGGLTGSLLLVLLSIFFVGFEGFLNYIDTVSKYTYGQNLMDDVSLPPGSGMGLFALLTSLFPNGSLHIMLYLFLTVALLVYSYFLRHKSLPVGNLEYALIIATSVGFSIQCIKYDLAMLLVPFALIVTSRDQTSLSLKLVLSLSIVGFYFEFLLRKVEIFGMILNLSSFVFIMFITTLILALQNKVQQIK